jgi:hypothetical protein
VRLDLAWEKPGRTLGRQFGRKADGDFSPSSKAGLAAFDLFLADLADWVNPRRRVRFAAWVAAPAAMRASMVNHSRFPPCVRAW